MENLNKLLQYCHDNIGKYFIKNKIHTFYDDECNFAFDIEACPTDETQEEIKKIMSDVVANVNSKIPNYKHIKNFVIRDKEFEKTTTQKIKRYGDNMKK